MHTVTNIEGFEINNGNSYFSTNALTNGGVNGTTAGALARLGTGQALFQFGQGWQRIPMVWVANGVPQLFPLACVAAWTRVYFAPQLFGGGWPANPTCVLAHCRQPTPTYVARVEFDSLGQLSLNGIKSGTPTPLVDTQYFMLELFTSSVDLLTQLWVNGILEVSIAGAIGTVDHVQLGDERVTAGAARTFDDLLIEADRISSAVIARPGEGRIERFRPNANGTDNAMSVFPAASQKYNVVSEDPPNADVDFVYSPGVAAAQTFRTWTRQMTGLPAIAPSACLAVGEGVRAVRVSNITRRNAGTVNYRLARIRSGVAVQETTVYTTTSGTYHMLGARVWQTDPATGAPWLAAAADALEAGLRIDNASTARDTNHYLLIERGVPFPVAARARINPVIVGGGGFPTMINPPILGG